MFSATNSKFLRLLLPPIFLCVAAGAQTYLAKDLGTLRHGSARIQAINTEDQAVGSSGFPHG
ncbi:MAG TPA: hypothetical protein VFY05_03535, partial [Candidatus Angelobacter sp.]|nr:hypothetical protein [Candidatus Angelobacter sp.]